ncbi:MAG: hypothetical protein HYT03_01780 [Candidatus Harrisonbacteria bacterium]|nr:hypothetical protein [Candidatus Harrisonbacteria bacterium]
MNKLVVKRKDLVLVGAVLLPMIVATIMYMLLPGEEAKEFLKFITIPFGK